MIVVSLVNAILSLSPKLVDGFIEEYDTTIGVREKETLPHLDLKSERLLSYGSRVSLLLQLGQHKILH